jgi:hypothetical protein
MRKLKFVLILLPLILPVQSFAQQPRPEDKIKSITVYEEKSNTLVGKQYKESETWYDQQGNITEEIKYSEGKVTRHFKYVYDQSGNKIKEEEYDQSGRLKESSEYRFENGLRMEKIVYDPGHKVRLRKTYVYTKF